MKFFDCGRSDLAKDCLSKFENLKDAFSGNDEIYFNYIRRTLEMTIPKKIIVVIKKKKGKFGRPFVAGYCPCCNGCVSVKFTFLRKFYGACCDWCGQRFVSNENAYFKGVLDDEKEK